MLDVMPIPSDEMLERLFPTSDDITNSRLPKSESFDTSVEISSKLSPGDKIERAFSLLKGKMQQALDGGLDPAVYVMSADAGTGKSTAVQALLAEWKGKGFRGDGAIIFLNTLAEVDAYVMGAKLDRADYAVYTSDPVYARYGAGREAAGLVPVLLTTHSMARRRLAKHASFKDEECFHYNGQPRALRVWDEAFLPAEYSSFELNDLHMLPSALKGRPRHLVAMFEALEQSRATVAAGDLIPIPAEIRGAADTVLSSGGKVTEQAKRTLEALAKLAGSDAVINGSADEGWYCIGIGLPIPADIAPLFVLDASARLTKRHCNWPSYGMKVVALEPAVLDYGNLAIHWWDRGCGKTAMNKSDDRRTIMGAVADLINSKPTESFLLVMSKDFAKIGPDGRPTIPDDLSRSVTDAERVSVTTWGRHLSSNDHRDIENVVILGSYNYGGSAYEALALTAMGAITGNPSMGDDRRREEAAEFKHNVYQAVCRVRCRNRTGGDCEPANAYMIMTDSDRRRELVRAAFPNCSFKPWAPVLLKENKGDKVLSALLRLLDGRSFVTKKELAAACGSDDRSYLTKINNQVRFKEALRRNYISRTGSMYVRSIPIKLAS
jgi:hypothetical protein